MNSPGQQEPNMLLEISGEITPERISANILVYISFQAFPHYIFLLHIAKIWGSKITADGDCSHEIKRLLLLGKKVVTNLISIFKSRDITLPTKVRLVEAMVFSIIMYGYESKEG